MDNNSIGYLGAFLGGLVVSFSPCVFPLIPITLGFIGVRAGASRLKGFTLSLVYVLGMAITYSALGLIAALTGRLFGEVSTHPVSYFIMGNACILAALSFFDVIHMPTLGIPLHTKIRPGNGFVSAFLLGITSGLVAGPCTTPVLGTILLHVAKQRQLLYGTSLLFVFAYGMGFILILVGTFSAWFVNLRHSQVWMSRVKKVTGLFLLGIGEYYLLKAGGLLCLD